MVTVTKLIIILESLDNNITFEDMINLYEINYSEEDPLPINLTIKQNVGTHECILYIDLPVIYNKEDIPSLYNKCKKTGIGMIIPLYKGTLNDCLAKVSQYGINVTVYCEDTGPLRYNKLLRLSGL